MKKIRVLLFLMMLSLLLVPPLHAASERLEKLPNIEVTDEKLRAYAEKQLKDTILIDSELGTGKILKEATEAGWGAFSVNFGVQGAAFTVLEECLSAAFLNNVNSICGEIGGGMVILQLIIDLSKGDFAAANINFGKGAVGYAIGKWGTKAMKLGMVGATAVELYLTTVANTVNQIHDDFYYNALRKHYYKGEGKRTLGEWDRIFKAANDGEGVNTTEEVLKIVDGYVEEFWDPDTFYAIIGDKDFTGGLHTRDVSPRLTEHKKHFKDYVKSVVIMPYLQSYFKRKYDQQVQAEMDKIRRNYGSFRKILNQEYTVKGRVEGPASDIKNLAVSIPDFLDTVTNDEGHFMFRFTLLSLINARLASANTGSKLTFELHVPQQKGYKVLKKEGHIKEKHRKSGVIHIVFKIDESSWKKCMEEHKKKSYWLGQICDLNGGDQKCYDYFCNAAPFELKEDLIQQEFRRLGIDPELRIREKMRILLKVYQEAEDNFQVERRKAELKDMKRFVAENCPANCRLQLLRESLRGPYPNDVGNYDIVCWDDKTNQYGHPPEANECGMKYYRYHKKAKLPASLDDSYRDFKKVESIFSLFRELEMCGYGKKAAKVNKSGVKKTKPKIDMGDILRKALED